MAKKKHAEQEPDINLVETYDKIEEYINENKQLVSYVVGIIALIIIGYFGYTKFYQAPREKEANNVIFRAQDYFEQDSLLLALNGDGSYPGLIDIIDDYSGTKTANLSHYYAGLCFLKLGDFEEAINYLEKFDADDIFTQTLAWGAIGDAYIELGETEKGIDYYKKAVGNKPNELITPFCLLKLGIAYDMIGNYSKAKEALEQILNDYPESDASKDIAKHLARINSKL